MLTLVPPPSRNRHFGSITEGRQMTLAVITMD